MNELLLSSFSTDEVWQAVKRSGNGRIRYDSINVNYTQVSDLIHAPTATWRLDILEALFDDEHVATICVILLSKSGKCDEIIWRLDGSGAYSVKSGYRLLRDDLPTAANVTVQAYSNLVARFFNEMWAVTLPAKVKINMWRIANSFVSTYSTLQNRRLNVNNVCPFCLSSGESIAHLMRDCSFVRQLFFAQGICFPSCPIYPDWLEWLAMIFCRLNVKCKIVLMVTLWAVWHARNKRVHEGTVATVHGTLSFITAFIRENATVCPPLSPGVLEESVTWQIPADGAITFAKELGFRRVVIEGDSLTVVKKVCSLTSDGSLISPIIYDIRAVAREFVSIGFQFIHRTGNNVAHALARVGRGQQVPSYWVEEAPPEAVAAAMLDLEKLVHLQ
ncbi:hypothetical protein V6N12_056696 [Hibiscus sabdariffa]|uniref:Reverse transcriptase n=1 Tax=Hibiscus sabdariffa TaxID=183260 RepID=A0ABR2DBW2_9ROSI